MAAVTGRIEAREELLDSAALKGLGALGAGAANLQPLETSHANLTRLAWLRRRYEDELSARSYELALHPKSGVLGVRVTPSFARATVKWSRLAQETEFFKFWGEANAKMGCPVFDLPAGAIGTGGSCPGADAGQTTVPRAKRPTTPEGFLRSPVPNIGLRQQLPPVRVVEGMTICSQCVTGDTRVMVRGRGLLRIEELVGLPPFEVWSGKEWRLTHAVFNGFKPTVQLSLSNGLILRATPDHRILTVDGMVEAQELSEDARLPWELVPDSPFPKSASLPLVALGEQYRTEKRGTLPTEWSYEMGVLLGYLVGDGCFAQGSEYPTLSLVAAERDRGDLERLIPFAAQWSGSDAALTIVSGSAGGSGLVSATNAQPTVHVAWRQKAMVALMRALGLSKDGAHTKVPDSIWRASQAGVAGFLSGLFSTDGSVGASRGVEISFANTARPLIDGVQQLLAAFGIRASLCEYKSNRERGYLPLWKLCIRARSSVLRFREVIGFFNARKAALLNEVIKAHLPKVGNDRLLTVDSVEDTGKIEAVYDLVNVGPEHQFVANGISVSNCYASEGSFAYASNQLREIVVFWWFKQMLQARRFDEVVAVLVDSMRRLRFPVAQGIMPVRLHSAGDFYSQEYARVWLTVAAHIYHMDSRVQFWAPTRTWAAPGWAAFWAEHLPGVPNLKVRASAYHFGDYAPGKLVADNAMGSTSLYASTARVPDELKLHDGDPRVDFNCGTYADDAGVPSCDAARNPEGKIGCRACWTHPHLRINYTAH